MDATTFPFKNDEIKPPYTEQTDNGNMKARDVYCPNCRYRVTTDLAGAKCGECGANLITVWKSVLA